jgi:peptide-methionine (R)-S-oxide reductase
VRLISSTPGLFPVDTKDRTMTTLSLSRRAWLGLLSALGVGAQAAAQTTAQSTTPAAPAGTAPRGAPTAAVPKIEPLVLSDAEWKTRLTPAQYDVLRREGTERAGTSPLNNEKRKGRYLCVGCDLPLFTSDMKYDSGTGWPSFFTTLPGAFKTKTDYKAIYPRTEYHCARCGGHHGHVFTDGPPPTNQRWCNNGVALKFEASAA